jgi:nitrogenase iron protein NifH
MSLYAANNIATAVNDFRRDGYARFGGLIQNSRGVENEDTLISDLAAQIDSEVVFRLPRSPTVQVCEKRDTTVISGEPDSEMAGLYRQLAKTVYDRSEDISGGLRLDKEVGCENCE